MSGFRQFAQALAGSAALALSATSALASPYHLMLETRLDSAAPSEVYIASFDSLNDVFASNIGAPTGFSQIAVAPDYRIVGLAYDGSYRVMLQTRLDSTAPSEVYMASFDTLSDVFAGNVGAPTGFSQISVTPDYQIVGLAYDGSYRVMLQTRLDSAAPFEVYMASFDTLDDVFAGNIGAPTGFSQIAVAPDYQIADFTYDGSYRVMLQSRLDSTAPSEVYIASFDTLNDLFAANVGAPTGFSQIAVAPDYQIVGFTGEWLPAPPVPEPGTFLLFGIGLAGLGFVRKCKAI